MNLNIDGEKYKCKVGKSHVLIRRQSDQKSFHPDFQEITGMHWNDIEKMSWKRSLMITPKLVSDYIRKNIQKNS